VAADGSKPFSEAHYSLDEVLGAVRLSVQSRPMRFTVERTDDHGSTWRTVGIGEGAPEDAIRQVTSEAGTYRVRPEDEPDTAAALYSLDANGVTTHLDVL
jgi:hypothetical protein